MTRKKIAPDLKTLVNGMDRYGDEEFERARRQMNALLRLARICGEQADTRCVEREKYDDPPCGWCDPCNLSRALRRLEEVGE